MARLCGATSESMGIIQFMCCARGGVVDGYRVQKCNRVKMDMPHANLRRTQSTEDTRKRKGDATEN